MTLERQIMEINEENEKHQSGLETKDNEIARLIKENDDLSKQKKNSNEKMLEY